MEIASLSVLPELIEILLLKIASLAAQTVFLVQTPSHVLAVRPDTSFTLDSV
jgi:hypothetical protein